MEKKLCSCPLPKSTSSMITSENLQLVNTKNPFIRAIQNNLVVNQLTEYLFLKDIQNLTLVSKDCLVGFRSTLSFSTRARYIIGDPKTTKLLGHNADKNEVSLTESLHVFQKSKYRWKNLAIQLGVPGLFTKNKISKIEHSMASVKSILLYTHSYHTSDADALVNLNLFLPVLKRMKHLCELEIYNSCTLLRRKIFSFGDGLKDIFCEVDNLKIDEISFYQPKCISQDVHNLQLTYKWNFQPSYYSNLKKFCVKLESWNINNNIRTKYVLNVIKLVELKKDTLEELQLHLDFEMNVFKYIKTIQLPKLKCLMVEIYKLKQEMIDFLQNQFPLKELRIRTWQFPSDLLKTLNEMDKLGKMEKLCIQAGYRPNTDSYSFLKGMTKLKVAHFLHHIACYKLRDLYPHIRINECSFGSSCFDFKCQFSLEKSKPNVRNTNY